MIRSQQDGTASCLVMLHILSGPKGFHTGNGTILYTARDMRSYFVLQLTFRHWNHATTLSTRVSRVVLKHIKYIHSYITTKLFYRLNGRPTDRCAMMNTCFAVYCTFQHLPLSHPSQTVTTCTLSHTLNAFSLSLFILPLFAVFALPASSSPRNGLQSKSGGKSNLARKGGKGRSESIPSVHLRFMRGCHEHFQPFSTSAPAARLKDMRRKSRAS